MMTDTVPSNLVEVCQSYGHTRVMANRCSSSRPLSWTTRVTIPTRTMLFDPCWKSSNPSSTLPPTWNIKHQTRRRRLQTLTLSPTLSTYPTNSRNLSRKSSPDSTKRFRTSPSVGDVAQDAHSRQSSCPRRWCRPLDGKHESVRILLSNFIIN